jgi:CheY-like chemotaxis protein
LRSATLLPTLRAMSEPLALVLGQRGVIALQLNERLEALRYRVKMIASPAELAPTAENIRAMVVLADCEGLSVEVLAAIAQLRANPATAHIPVIAFTREAADEAQARLTASGATAVVTEAAVLDHLPQLLNRALELP